MVLDRIPQPLPVHFFGSRPQTPTSRDAKKDEMRYKEMWDITCICLTCFTFLSICLTCLVSHFCVSYLIFVSHSLVSLSHFSHFFVSKKWDTKDDEIRRNMTYWEGWNTKKDDVHRKTSSLTYTERRQTKDIQMQRKMKHFLRISSFSLCHLSSYFILLSMSCFFVSHRP